MYISIRFKLKLIILFKRQISYGSENIKILCPWQIEHMGAPRLETFIFEFCTGVEVLVRVKRKELSSGPRMYQPDGKLWNIAF